MFIRIYDAYRRGLLTITQFDALIDAGYSPNDTYTPGSVPPSSDDAEDTESGTTTNAYVAALSINTESIYKTFIIKNTGVTNSLTYKIEIYANNDSDICYSYGGEKVLTAGSSDIVLVNFVTAAIELSVKSTSTGLHTTYQTDYTGY